LVRWRSVSGSLDRSLALRSALTFGLSPRGAACDGAAPIVRASLRLSRGGVADLS
jgi:hypothetical protein